LSWLSASTVDDTAYNEGTWDANTDAPTKNAVRDKVETMDTAIGLNTSKVTNATHTGEVTGATTLTIANRTGADTGVVTGTKGTSGDLAEWNADGDLVDGPTPPTGTIVGTTDTQTLTNKRITSRTGTAASSASLTINSDNYDRYTITALAADMLINNPTGTPTDGQKLMIRIKDNATARAITYGAQFRAIGVTLLTTTVISKTHYMGFEWNSADSKWDGLAIGSEA